MPGENHHHNPVNFTMSDETFDRFSSFIKGELGIKMPSAKKTMLQARLQKRIRRLKIRSFEEYGDYLFSAEGMRNELKEMFDVVTTNKTDFFREPRHFDYLVQNVLPGFVNSSGPGISRKLNVWSAGCSTGMEPYTLAMVLSEFAANYNKFQFSILATDISSKVLEKAALGIYKEEDVIPISMDLRKKYLLKSREKTKNLVRIVPELRSLIKFQRLNFMDNKLAVREPMDIIFCRNVIIYFDRPTQEKVLNSLNSHLRPGGYMFMGHSETLNGLNVPLTPVATTVYRKLKGNTHMDQNKVPANMAVNG